MGYSFLQIPNFIKVLFVQIRKYLTKTGSGGLNYKKHSTFIQGQKMFPEYVDYGSLTMNLNTEGLRIIRSDLKHMSRRLDAVENFIYTNK